MRYTFALAALCSIAAATPSPVPAPAPIPQAVTSAIAPSSMPSSCASTYMNGDYFQIGLLAAGSSKSKRQVGPGQNPDELPGNILLLSLLDGKLTDGRNRTGYIASNRQLQFDVVPQAGALITSGFSACPNDTLALSSATWYSCGSGKFGNLYDESIGGQCQPLNLAIYLFTENVSSAIAGISAATMNLGASATATGVLAGVGGAAATSVTATNTAASASASVMSGSASATGAAGSASASRSMSTGTRASSSSAASGAATTTAAAARNGASGISVGKSSGALVALIGFMAFML